jgi:hypothetical protein
MVTAAGSRPVAPDVSSSAKRRPRALDRAADVVMWTAAASVALSAVVHLHLWLTGYRNIPTIGPLFLGQAVAGFVLAATLAWTRHPALALFAVLFLVATIGGLLTSAWFGLFGFHDGLDAPYARVSVVVEGTGAVLLCACPPSADAGGTQRDPDESAAVERDPRSEEVQHPGEQAQSAETGHDDRLSHEPKAATLGRPVGEPGSSGCSLESRRDLVEHHRSCHQDEAERDVGEPARDARGHVDGVRQKVHRLGPSTVRRRGLSRTRRPRAGRGVPASSHRGPDSAAILTTVAGRTRGVGVVAVALAASACSAPAGTAPAGAPTTTVWTEAAQIQPAPPSEEISDYGVSCPTSSSCIAVDENGAAHSWRGGHWSPAEPVPAGGTLTTVSCPTVVHCVAVSSDGNASTFDARSWSPGRPIGPAATYRVSCPTADFCAAVGASGTPGGPKAVTTFDGSSWSTTVSPPNPPASVGDRLSDVSCPTTSSCIAVDLDGSALTYDGTSWSPNRGPALRGTTSVSCPTPSFCMAVGQGGYSTFSRGRWSAPSAVPGFQSAFFPDVSCASAHSCTVIGLNGESSQWRGGSWSAPVAVFTGEFLGTVAISCATTRFCMAVNSRGTAAHT